MPGGFTPPEQIKSIRGPRAACRVGIGDGGGNIVVTGTPEEVAACEASYTGRYLPRRTGDVLARFFLHPAGRRKNFFLPNDRISDIIE